MADIVIANFGFKIAKIELLFGNDRDLYRYRDFVKDYIYKEMPDKKIITQTELAEVLDKLLIFIMKEIAKRSNEYIKRFKDEDKELLTEDIYEFEIINEDFFKN